MRINDPFSSPQGTRPGRQGIGTPLHSLPIPLKIDMSHINMDSSIHLALITGRDIVFVIYIFFYLPLGTQK